MTPEKKSREKRILELQRDLLNECMEYQIEYGVGTISFTARLNFIRERNL